jgi:transposase-like protein
MKVKTRSQLADDYGISRKTLYNWLKAYNIKLPRGQITPKDQIKIIELLGPIDKPKR